MIAYNHIELAHSRISKDIHFTPILTSESINNDTESNLFFKCENFQKTGSFKIRGATNAILQLSKKQVTKGIVTTSSGIMFIIGKILATRDIIHIHQGEYYQM